MKTSKVECFRCSNMDFRMKNMMPLVCLTFILNIFIPFHILRWSLILFIVYVVYIELCMSKKVKETFLIFKRGDF